MKYAHKIMILASLVPLTLAACGAEGAGHDSDALRSGAVSDNPNNSLKLVVDGASVEVQSVLVNTADSANGDQSIVVLFSSRPDACDLVTKNEIGMNSGMVGVRFVNQTSTGPNTDPNYAAPTAGNYTDTPNPLEGNTGLYEDAALWDVGADCSLKNASSPGHVLALTGQVTLAKIQASSAAGTLTLKSADGTTELSGSFKAVNCPALSSETYNLPTTVKDGPKCAHQ